MSHEKGFHALVPMWKYCALETKYRNIERVPAFTTPAGIAAPTSPVPDGNVIVSAVTGLSKGISSGMLGDIPDCVHVVGIVGITNVGAAMVAEFATRYTAQFCRVA